MNKFLLAAPLSLLVASCSVRPPPPTAYANDTGDHRIRIDVVQRKPDLAFGPEGIRTDTTPSITVYFTKKVQEVDNPKVFGFYVSGEVRGSIELKEDGKKLIVNLLDRADSKSAPENRPSFYNGTYDVVWQSRSP